MSTSYPLFEARGNHRELGRQHGEQVKDRLIAFVDYLGNLLKLSGSRLRGRAMRFLPLFEKHAPHLVDEIRGLAEGAGVSFEEALIPQIRGELGQVQEGGCTTFVISGSGNATGGILIGQNSDVEPELEDLAYMLRLLPEGKPSVLMWTFGGQLGYHGMNAAGVAHFANSLGGGPSWRFGLPHYPVKRMMLEQRTIGDVLRVLDRAPVCSSGNYVLCDGEGRIADVELTAEGYEVIDGASQGYLVHSNHFICGSHACSVNDAASVPDSFPRMERIRTLLGGKFGSLTINDVKRALADHEGHPTSICRHPHGGPDHPSVSARGHTVASLIAEPAAGRMHVSRGNPCQASYAVYTL